MDLTGAYRQYLEIISSLLATDRLRQRLWVTVFDTLINNISDDHILIDNYTMFIDRYIQKQDVFSPWFIRLPYKRLADYGNMHDLESSLGHFVQLMSFPQDNEDELSLYAPCAFSIPDRVVNYGPEISALYSYNVHRHYFDTKRMALRDVYALHWKTWEHFSPTWFQRSHQKVRRDLYLLSSFIKSRRLLWTLLRSSQHFYEEGIRFYMHDQPTELYIGSSSPGILIPEEFYGEEIYYPGIGKHVAPTADIFDTQKDRFNSFINLRWILQENIHNNVSVANPFRIPYFTMGIGYNTKNKTINYSIFKSSAFATLRANKNSWAKKGKQAAYEEDIVALYKWFSRKIKISNFSMAIRKTPRITRIHWSATMDFGIFQNETQSE